MKLIEKKCPNCGANLKFDKDDKSVSCDYCQTYYEIQRDADLNDLTRNEYDSDDFILHRKIVNSTSKLVIIFSVLIFIFVMCVFMFIFINGFSNVIK